MAEDMADDEQEEEMTEPCNDLIEPNCQQYEATKHQVIRGTSKPFEHYAPGTYNPGPKGVYYNPMATAGVYNGAKPGAKAAALAQQSGLPACAPALELTQKELNLQMESFSRTFDKQFYANAWKIYSELSKINPATPLPSIQSFQLYDKAFTWPRVRAYEFTQEQLYKL